MLKIFLLLKIFLIKTAVLTKCSILDVDLRIENMAKIISFMIFHIRKAKYDVAEVSKCTFNLAQYGQNIAFKG